MFTDLARKTPALPAATTLAGWLHRAACHAAAKAVRGNVRRAQRERLAMQIHALPDDATTQAAETLQPLVDEALAALPEADRDAVLLRFFAGKSLAEVGAVLGVNEDTAQKRVSRALEKLRENLRRRGVEVGSGLVATALTVAAAQTAPAGLAVSLASGALAGVGTTTGAASLLLLMKSKLALGIVGGAVVATTLAWQQHRVQRLAEENGALQQQVADLSTVSMIPAPVALAAADAEELTRLRGEHLELLRLRGEVARLRQQVQRLPDLERQIQAAQRAAEQGEVMQRIVEQNLAEQHAEHIVLAMKNLGLAARIYSTDHQDRLPATFDEMRKELNELLGPDGNLPGGISTDQFEFFPQERVISEFEPHMILFREKKPRQLPNGAWQRIYCLTDGSVRQIGSPNGDFGEFERTGTATATNAPQ